MSQRFLAAVPAVLLLLSAAGVGAEESPGFEERLRALEESLARERAESAARIDALEREIASLRASLAQTPAPSALPPPAPDEPGPQPVALLSGAGGKNYLNLSLDALVSAGTSTSEDIGLLQPGGHDPNQRGFTLQNVELTFDGAVDPWFRGQANLVFLLDAEGETVVELEEAFATTTSLPGRIQLKAGQFYTEFGRHNPLHPHSWDFVDVPLAVARLLGPDGQRQPGLRASWLAPAPFFLEAGLAVQDSRGETARSFLGEEGETLFGRTLDERSVRSLDDLLWSPRLSASWDLADTQTVLLGGSASFGPNATGDGGRTAIWGLDAFWKWKAANADRGFPFVKVQAEYLDRSWHADPDPDAGLPAETFRDWGAYAQVNWGFRPRMVAGLRLERVAGDTGDPSALDFAPRTRVSPAFTWFPTEFSKLRFQWNHDEITGLGNEGSFWVQFEFLLGAHAAHKF